MEQLTIPGSRQIVGRLQNSCSFLGPPVVDWTAAHSSSSRSSSNRTAGHLPSSLQGNWTVAQSRSSSSRAWRCLPILFSVPANRPSNHSSTRGLTQQPQRVVVSKGGTVAQTCPRHQLALPNAHSKQLSQPPHFHPASVRCTLHCRAPLSVSVMSQRVGRPKRWLV